MKFDSCDHAWMRMTHTINTISSMFSGLPFYWLKLHVCRQCFEKTCLHDPATVVNCLTLINIFVLLHDATCARMSLNHLLCLVRVKMNCVAS